MLQRKKSGGSRTFESPRTVFQCIREALTKCRQVEYILFSYIYFSVWNILLNMCMCVCLVRIFGNRSVYKWWCTFLKPFMSVPAGVALGPILISFANFFFSLMPKTLLIILLLWKHAGCLDILFKIAVCIIWLPSEVLFFNVVPCLSNLSSNFDAVNISIESGSCYS